MDDRKIREALKERLRRAHANDAETLVLDELGIATGQGRADVVVINGRLEGYEIKGKRDRVTRLPGQVRLYNRVFDRATVIVTENHVQSAKRLVPRWWGIEVASENKHGKVTFSRLRAPRINPALDPFVVAQLLWRTEVVAIMEELGVLQASHRRLPRRELWTALLSKISVRQLRTLVRRQLRTRTGWRAA